MIDMLNTLPAASPFQAIAWGIVLGIILSPAAWWLGTRAKTRRAERPTPTKPTVIVVPKTQPQSTTRATAVAAPGADPISVFLIDCCDIARIHRATAAEIRSAYHAWCTAAGVDPVNDTALGRALSAMGFTKSKSRGLVCRTGLAVRPEWIAA